MTCCIVSIEQHSMLLFLHHAKRNIPSSAGIFLQVKYGSITYETTFENYTMLTGNVVSLFLGGLICVVVSLIFPEDYDFISMKQIKMLDEAEDGDKGFTKVGTIWPSAYARVSPR